MQNHSPTHFDRLGMPRRFPLSEADLEQSYLARSRALHPDFHQTRSTAEQRASLELSAALNEAYTTLRQPFRRAEYLLGLEGGPSASEHKQMDSDFLEEMLELRMEIEELRETSDLESPAVLGLEKKLDCRRAALLDQISADFTSLEKAAPNQRPALLLQIRQHLNSARYIEGLLRDLRAPTV